MSSNIIFKQTKRIEPKKDVEKSYDKNRCGIIKEVYQKKFRFTHDIVEVHYYSAIEQSLLWHSELKCKGDTKI